ncbi:homing endonuclease associated repeat-containing protein [Halosegnis longus]|uniref:HNH endonuclease n=1 Tax=Halosegnis longus TaxID=2216012 RepID=A0AAJ4R613_9EURY|nr:MULTISPECIES: HNH endonuclease [Halobacteriales]RNJ25276.1 HNH endonuclease [Salella cibi]
MVTERECLDALRQAAAELDESPSKVQYDELGYQPASTTIMRVVGGWNEAKARAGLETVEAGGQTGISRVEPKPDDVELDDGEVWEELSPHQRWYRKNRDRQQGKKKRRRKELRAWLAEYKREHCQCERCGESDPACLDFHHPDGVEKRDGVARMVNRAFSKASIREEIEKCIVLCANCHRKEHDDSGDPE